jgi:hypothetical protein
MRYCGERVREEEEHDVTCYMRHMAWLFDAVGLPDGKTERRRLDTALRQVLGTPDDAHCPEVWAAYKSLTDDEHIALVPRVREALDL